MRIVRSTGPPVVQAVLGGLAALVMAVAVDWGSASVNPLAGIAQNNEQTITAPIAKLIGGTDTLAKINDTAPPIGGTEPIIAKVVHIDANTDNAANKVEVMNASDNGDTADPAIAKMNIGADPANTVATSTASLALPTEANDVAWLGEPADLIVRV